MSAPILTPGEVTGQLVERIADLESLLAEKQRACDILKIALDAETNKCVNLRRAVCAMLEGCDRNLYTLPCGHYNDLRAALRDGRTEP